MEKSGQQIADYLLQIKAIKLEPSNPFTWASGWKSPIYCDNRKTLSFPEVREYIRDTFSRIISEKYPQAEVIAGVATGAIAHGMMVADKMGLPFIYVRPGAKDHGLGNQVEGYFEAGQKVVVVEDLISTGGSSLNAVRALRDAGCDVAGMVAIFTYGFEKSVTAFRDAGCELTTLSNYAVLVERALEQGYVSDTDIEALREWRRDPSSWKGSVI
jgi:orotate phosphoribosyltransferase